MNKEEQQDFKNLKKRCKLSQSALNLSRIIDYSFPKLGICQISLHKQQFSAERIHNSNQGIWTKKKKLNTAKIGEKSSRFKEQQTKRNLVPKEELQQKQEGQYYRSILFKVKTIQLRKKIQNQQHRQHRLIKINKIGSAFKENKKRSTHQKRLFNIRKKENKKQQKPLNQVIMNQSLQQVVNQKNLRRETRRRTYINLLTQITEFSKRDSFSILKIQQLSSLRDYYSFLSKACQQISLSFYQVESYAKGQLTYNIPITHTYLHKAMRQRWWWQQSKSTSTSVSFQQLSSFQKMSPIKIAGVNEQSMTSSSEHSIQTEKDHLFQKSVIKHLSNGKYLTNPIGFNFIINQDNQVFSPISFYIDRYRGENWHNFTLYFFSKDKDKLSPYNSKRQWIIKNGQQNLKLFKILSNYQQIKQFIITHTKDDRSFVIQEYKENQFLLDEQKIDIHTFILISNLNGVINCYWYDDGFVEVKEDFKQRPSSAEDLSFNFFKNNRSRSAKKIENKISFEDFQAYCNHLRKNKFSFIQCIVPLMKQAAINLLLSSHSILLQQGTQSRFQIYELKFIIDQLLKPWLIKVSTISDRPSSSQVLEKLYTSLVDDSLKLSIDLVYPPPLNWPASKQLLLAPTCGSTKFNLIFQSTNKTPAKKLSEFPFREKINMPKQHQQGKNTFQFNSHTCPQISDFSSDF